MQEDEDTWRAYADQFKINVIYFYRHDATPWAQPFLIRRLNDRFWIPVYVDDYTIIFLKRTIQNEPIIMKYELPRSMFVIHRNA